ncbi:MAG: SUMF1/EgtB/PvdO family nonheme iron enzyme [Ignavibacteria bacterium]|nr:SUMF1/EgtB/PvdO family nonheme iron enzyme [Ignavibacteria bacterium]
MKTKTIIVFISCLLLSTINSSIANNISVSNISLTGQNIQNHYTFIKFDIQWDNSWRVSSDPGNWDAAWVFIKFRVNSGQWQHAWLNDAGHNNPPGSTISVGLLDPSVPFNATTNPGMGVFMYRDAAGTGTFSKTNVQLRWNYGANGLSDNATVNIRIYAIEHVYIPPGSFYLGSGGTETSAFYKYPSTSNPYQVTSEGEIIVGTAADNLYYNYSTYGGDRLGPIPASFPKGFKTFYCMKYEISQQGYADFLNSITSEQASYRYFSSTSFRYAISVLNGVYSTANPYVACNNLNWADKIAYFDWSGLRPLTELEYEKACRGTLPPVPNEYAWGNTNVANSPYALSNSGANNETIASNYSTVSGNAAYNLTTPYNGAINGPLRAGIFSGNNNNTGRITAGATYYGVMEMSGNLLEHFVTVGNPAGREFTGKHGNGILNVYGNADVTGWPGASSYGAGFRGGYWYYYSWYLRVSERSGAAGTDANRYDSDGGRGGRTAP